MNIDKSSIHYFQVIKKDAEAPFSLKQLSFNYFLAARLAASAALTSEITVSHTERVFVRTMPTEFESTTF